MKILRSVFVVILFCISVQVNAQENEYNLDETYSIDKNATIHLSSDDTDVSVRGTDRSDVHLVVFRRVEVDGWKVESGGKFEIEVENENGDLYIREKDNDEHRVVMGSVKEEYRITIEAPRDVALNLQGDDGTYQISDFNLGIHLSADDSEINLSNMKGDDFSFDIDDGSIQMDEGRGELELNLDDGEFSVQKGDFTDINADFDDSEVEITTSLADDGAYRFDMDDGDLRINITGGGGEFDIRHEDTDISVSDNFEKVRSDEERSVYRLSGGNARIEVDSDDGDIKLRTI